MYVHAIRVSMYAADIETEYFMEMQKENVYSGNLDVLFNSECVFKLFYQHHYKEVAYHQWYL